ncbi:MAG TPA: hypothetical protein VNI84_03745 [Pyrinomonadaceae bacterium]|nr:hypothetical protein [Pyrinomonadaceae bacterium]
MSAGQPVPIERNAAKIADEAVKLPDGKSPNAAGETAVGRGTAGQPIGQPTTEPTTQNALMPNVVTGRDPSQLIAPEKMRSNAGHSATDVLLGLNRQPSTLGAMLAPPGNLAALRHLSPQMRRTVLRNLLTKQRGQMRRLVAVMRDAERRTPDEENQNEENAGETPTVLTPVGESAFYNRRAVQDLEATTRMLDLLDELLGMQDYTLSQMGTFAQG